MASVDERNRFNDILKKREQIIDRINDRMNNMQVLVDERFAIQERMRIIHSRRFVKLCLYRLKVMKFLLGTITMTGNTQEATSTSAKTSKHNSEESSGGEDNDEEDNDEERGEENMPVIFYFIVFAVFYIAFFCLDGYQPILGLLLVQSVLKL